ncbi:hypothetical protein ON010_g7051 [Phytophthora cinnamomi]|nr:hypothetical protein ON010_g7051 [Phytophthora cinnamomi]
MVTRGCEESKNAGQLLTQNENVIVKPYASPEAVCIHETLVKKPPAAEQLTQGENKRRQAWQSVEWWRARPPLLLHYEQTQRRGRGSCSARRSGRVFFSRRGQAVLSISISQSLVHTVVAHLSRGVVADLAETSQSRAHRGGRGSVQQVGAAGDGLVARAALPDARHVALDRVLAAENTVVLGVLRDFDLLHHLTERRAVARASQRQPAAHTPQVRDARRSGALGRPLPLAIPVCLRVVYVDGIPIESNLLDAGESGLKGEEKNDPVSLAALDPRALFDKYDTDGSGDIDFEEFKVLLNDLGVNLTEPKARAYFKRCDRRRRGSISFDEFRLALYTCDPKNPDRTGGFAPGQSLAPKDLFEMFDKDEEGAIDRGTFMELLEFIGHKMPLDKMEELFATYEDPDLEMMPYVQFKKAWLTVVDVQAELRLRGERFNRFLPNSILAKKLAMLVNMEEKQEAMTLLEANNTLNDEIIAAQRRELVKEAQLLARVTLAEALDAAGQVYVFGKGAYQRFDSEPREPDFVEFMEYGIVRSLWHQRVSPPPGKTPTSPVSDSKEELSSTPVKDSKAKGQSVSRAKQPDTKDNNNNNDGGSDFDDNHKHPSPSRTKIETSARAFAHRQVSKATAFLWGKRVTQVSCGAAVAYALTDAGEVFCWGGNKRQWRYFYDEATAESEVSSSTLPSTDERGSDVGVTSKAGSGIEDLTKEGVHRKSSLLNHPLTTRSEMLRLFALPSQVTESHEVHDQLGLRVKYAKVFERPIPLIPTEEDKRRRLHLVGRYYGLLDPVAPPTAGKPPILPSLEELMETVEPELDVDDLSLSLFMRGVELTKPTRMALLETLGECLELELECVGDQFHDHFKQQDQIARRYRKERREKPLMRIVAKANALWYELGGLRDSMLTAEKHRLIKGEEEYNNMKRKITHATQKLKRRAREGHSAIVAADGGSNNNDNNKSISSDGKQNEEALLYINGLTSRGPALHFF